MTKEQLEKEFTVEQLSEMLPLRFAVGITAFTEPEKRWLCEGYYNPLWEYATIDGDFNPERYLKPEFKETPTYYGASLKEVLIETIYQEQLNTSENL